MLDARFDIDMDKVRDFLSHKEDLRRAAVDLRFEKAKNDFNRIIDRIIALHKPRRIYQWGSLLDRSRFSEISDIDIALEGIDGPERSFALLADIEGLTDFPLDIVELERIGEENARWIRETGVLVYDQYANA